MWRQVLPTLRRFSAMRNDAWLGMDSKLLSTRKKMKWFGDQPNHFIFFRVLSSFESMPNHASFRIALNRRRVGSTWRHMNNLRQANQIALRVQAFINQVDAFP